MKPVIIIQRQRQRQILSQTNSSAPDSIPIASLASAAHNVKRSPPQPLVIDNYALSVLV